MKKLFFAAILGICLLPSCKDSKTKTKKNIAEDYSTENSGNKTEVEKGTKMENNSKTENGDGGYDISAPAGWSKKDTFFMGQHMVFVKSPRENESDDFLENVNVVTEKIGSMKMDEYLDLSTTNIKKGLTDVEEGKISDRNFNGMDFKCVRYSHVYGSTPIDVDAYFTIDNGTAYVITCSAKGGTISKWEPAFEEIVRSFHLK